MIPSREKVYYPGLDGLRGIAIILVVIYHYFSFFRIGWIGVDLFFVLSGFLITTSLLNTREKKNYFKNFYIRRALRIFPVYYLFLLAFYICLNYFFQQRGAQTAFAYYIQYQFWFLSFTQNWLIIKNGPPPEPYLIHFWSLGIEEQFYIFWPFIIYFITDTKILQGLLVILFFLAFFLRLYLLINGAGYQSYFYNSIARFDSLAAGAFLSLMIHRNQKISGLIIKIIIFAFCIIFLLAALISKDFDHDSVLFATIGYSISALFFMVACFLAVTKYSYFFRNAFLKFIGRISYGIYVFHLPVFLVGNFLLKKTNFFAGRQTGILFLIPLTCIIITLVISFVSYKVLELPLLRIKKNFT